MINKHHPHRESCVVRIPARTSISVLDMNAFSPGAAGGGNLGFALAAYTELGLAIAERDHTADITGEIWRDERRSLIDHVLQRWRTLTASIEHFAVTVRRTNPPHIGLASSAALQTAVWLSLNHIYGSPLTNERIRALIAQEYRESDREELTLGFTTGLSAFLAQHGGFAVVGPRLEPLFHMPVPRWAAAVVTPKGVSSISFGPTELKILTTTGPKLDRAFHTAKVGIVFQELIPAVQRQDLIAIGEAIGKLQANGSKLAEIEIYGDTVKSTLRQLRPNFACSFMSAVGPGIVVIDESSPEELSRKLQALDLSMHWCGQIASDGATFLLDHDL